MVAPHRKKGELQTKVIDYLELRKSTPVSLPVIAKAVGEDEKTTQQAISRLVHRNIAHIDVITRGHVWIYHGLNGADRFEFAKPKENRRGDLFECIGETKDGSLVLEDAAGKIYRAIEL
jgi:hypothetical protein